MRRLSAPNVLRQQAANIMVLQELPLITMVLFFAQVEAETQNCTANVCDLKTCTNKTDYCTQNCYTSQCSLSCTSHGRKGCISDCKAGGCSKMFCDSAVPETTCMQKCKKNCKNMICKANSCFPHCMGDNCKMTCQGTGNQSGCYAKCFGKGCEINVHSFNAEIQCDKGSCHVRFSKGTNGYVTCLGGNCTLTCAKGKYCRFNRACPNCTGPVFVDDPFGGASGANALMTVTNKGASFILMVGFLYLIAIFF